MQRDQTFLSKPSRPSLATVLVTLSLVILICSAFWTKAKKDPNIAFNRHTAELINAQHLVALSSPQLPPQHQAQEGQARNKAQHVSPARKNSNVFDNVVLQEAPYHGDDGTILLSSATDVLPRSAAVIAAPRPPEIISQRYRFKKGDTLSKALDQSGLSGDYRDKIIKVLKEHINVHRIKAGQYLEISWNDESLGQHRPRLVRYVPDQVRHLDLTWDNHDFRAKWNDHKTMEQQRYASGYIKTSLYEETLAHGLPLPLLTSFIDIFSSDVDFQREIRAGDHFALFYTNSLRLADGQHTDPGTILVATLVNQDQTLTYYRYEDSKGHVDYYDSEGESARRAIVKTPIDGARISSGFGMRRHPILGFTRLHSGLDFAVPSGTPVYGAGNGVVVAAGRKGGYGIYLKIRHAGGYATAYAHLSRIRKGIRRGSKIKQGQIVAYSGNTGLSTGPHLHYEVHFEGRAMNPLKLKLPRVSKLKSEELRRFNAEHTRLAALQETHLQH